MRSRRTGASIASNKLGELVGRLDQAGIERADVAFLAEALVLAGGAGADLLADQRQELLGRTHHRAVGEPGLPVGRGQPAAEVEQAAERVQRLDVFAQQVLDAAFEATGAAAAAAFGAQDPAPEVRAFDAAQMRAERAVGRIEQVMALVEHVARRPRRIVEPAHRRLDHDQRMVGDDDVGRCGRGGWCVRRSTSGSARRPE